MLPSISKLTLACPPCKPQSAKQAAPTGGLIRENLQTECPACLQPIRQTLDWQKDPAILDPPEYPDNSALQKREDIDIANGLAKDTFFNVRCGHVVHLACQAAWVQQVVFDSSTNRPTDVWKWRCCFENAAFTGEQNETIIEPAEREAISARISGEGVRYDRGVYWTAEEQARVTTIKEHLATLRETQALQRNAEASSDAAAVEAAVAAATVAAKAEATEREQEWQSRIAILLADIAQYKAALAAVEESSKRESEAALQVYEAMQGKAREQQDSLEAANFIVAQRERAVKEGKAKFETLQNEKRDADGNIAVLQKQLADAQERSSELQTSLEEARRNLSSAAPPPLRRLKSAPGNYLPAVQRQEQERREKAQANGDAMLMMVHAAQTLNSKLLLLQLEKITHNLISFDYTFQRPVDRKSVLHALFTPSTELQGVEEPVDLIQQSSIMEAIINLFDNVPKEQRNKVKKWLQESRDSDHFTILCLASKTCTKAMCAQNSPNPQVLPLLSMKIHEAVIRWLVTDFGISITPYSPNDGSKRKKPKSAKNAYEFAQYYDFPTSVVDLLRPPEVGSPPSAPSPVVDKTMQDVETIVKFANEIESAIVRELQEPSGSENLAEAAAEALAPASSKKAAADRRSRARLLRERRAPEVPGLNALIADTVAGGAGPSRPIKKETGRVAKMVMAAGGSSGFSQELREAVNGKSDEELLLSDFIFVLPQLAALIKYVDERFVGMEYPDFNPALVTRRFIFFLWYSHTNITPNDALFRRFVYYLWAICAAIYPKTLAIFENDIFYVRKDMLTSRYNSVSKDAQVEWYKHVILRREDSEYKEFVQGLKWEDEWGRESLFKVWNVYIDGVEHRMVTEDKLTRLQDPVLSSSEQETLQDEWDRDHEIVDEQNRRFAVDDMYKAASYFPPTRTQLYDLFDEMVKKGLAVTKRQRLALLLSNLDDVKQKMITVRASITAAHLLDNAQKMDATMRRLRKTYEGYESWVEAALVVIKSTIRESVPELESELNAELAESRLITSAGGGASSSSTSAVGSSTEEARSDIYDQSSLDEETVVLQSDKIISVNLQQGLVFYEDGDGRYQSVKESDLDALQLAKVGGFLNKKFKELVEKRGLQKATEEGEKPPATHHKEYRQGMKCELGNANEPLHVAFREKLKSLIPAQRLSGDFDEIVKISYNGKPDLDLLPEEDFFAGNPDLVGATDVQIVQYQLLKALRVQSQFIALSIDTSVVGINMYSNINYWLNYIHMGIANGTVVKARTVRIGLPMEKFWKDIALQVLRDADADADITVDNYVVEWEHIYEAYEAVAGIPPIRPGAVEAWARQKQPRGQG